jgi:hypothetical protein
MTDIDRAIESELATYYNGDELPFWDRFIASLPMRVPASSRRLRAAVGEGGVAELVTTLHRLRDEPDHPMHGHIAGSSQIHWPEDPESWQAFRAFADLLVAMLQADGPQATQ